MKKFFSIIITLILIVSLAACGGPDLKTPESTVKGFCESVRALNLEDVQKYLSRNIINERTLGLNYMPESFVSLLKDLNASTTYTVNTPEINGDSAEVSIDVQYIDSASIMQEAFDQYTAKAKELAAQGKKMSTSDMEDLLIQSIGECAKNGNPEKISATATFELTKTDGSWKITSVSENIANIILCNMLDAIDSVL